MNNSKVNQGRRAATPVAICWLLIAAVFVANAAHMAISYTLWWLILEHASMAPHFASWQRFGGSIACAFDIFGNATFNWTLQILIQFALSIALVTACVAVGLGYSRDVKRRNRHEMVFIFGLNVLMADIEVVASRANPWDHSGLHSMGPYVWNIEDACRLILALVIGVFLLFQVVYSFRRIEKPLEQFGKSLRFALLYPVAVVVLLKSPHSPQDWWWRGLMPAAEFLVAPASYVNGILGFSNYLYGVLGAALGSLELGFTVVVYYLLSGGLFYSSMAWIIGSFDRSLETSRSAKDGINTNVNS